MASVADFMTEANVQPLELLVTSVARITTGFNSVTHEETEIEDYHHLTSTAVRESSKSVQYLNGKAATRDQKDMAIVETRKTHS